MVENKCCEPPLPARVHFRVTFVGGIYSQPPWRFLLIGSEKTMFPDRGRGEESRQAPAPASLKLPPLHQTVPGRSEVPPHPPRRVSKPLPDALCSVARCFSFGIGENALGDCKGVNPLKESRAREHRYRSLPSGLVASGFEPQSSCHTGCVTSSQGPDLCEALSVIRSVEWVGGR